MARTISKDTLEQKISKLETAISKNRQQYDQLTKELKELLDKQKALQSEELMKAIADSTRSYEDTFRYIKGETRKTKDKINDPKLFPKVANKSHYKRFSCKIFGSSQKTLT